jgi:hypothetical protein
MGEMRTVNESDRSEDVGVDRRIILKWNDFRSLEYSYLLYDIFRGMS